MKTTSNPIIFFGNERLATSVETNTPVLRALIEAGYDIKAIVANYEKGISRAPRELEIEILAKEHNIPLLLPRKPKDIIDQLISFGAEAGVLIAYGKIVPQSIIDIFPRGIINIHPSLLPLHRGPTPIESVILNGEKETGISIMMLAKEMDAGPVYIQKRLPLSGNESKQGLTNQLLKLGCEMLIENFPIILSGEMKPTPQDDNAATYDKLINKADGIIDWNKSAKKLESEIRAYYGWPGSRTTLFGKEITVTEVEINSENGKPGTILYDKKTLLVRCGKGSLSINRLKPAGKNEMPVEAFLAGIPADTKL